MSAHTKGPWVIQDTVTPDGGHIRYVLADTAHCEVAVLYTTTKQQEANAHLIAAAPDLLATLIEVIDAGDYSVETDDDVAAMMRFGKACEAARRAIDKAEGR